MPVGLTACGDDEEQDATAPAVEETPLDLTIGDIVPLTGKLADFGPPGRKAASVAVEEIESAIDEVGADDQVTIQHEDEGTSPAAAIAAARELAGEGATCLAGAWASADTIPVGRSVATQEELLQISPASASDELTPLEDNGLVNRTVPPDSLQGPALADAMAQELGGAEGKTVNIGARKDTYGTGLAETFGAAWEQKGGTIGEQVLYDPELPSYDSEADQLTATEPDAYVIFDLPPTYEEVGPALVRTRNFDPEITFATDGLATTELPEDAGEAATQGVRGIAPGVPENGGPSEAFDKLYKESGGPERQTFDAQNFDAVILCYLAAVAAGSTEGAEMAAEVRRISAPGGTKYSWEDLPEAIEALQNGEDIDYEGASGPIDMNEAGDATAGVYDVYEFQKGDIEITDQVSVGPRAEQ